MTGKKRTERDAARTAKIQAKAKQIRDLLDAEGSLIFVAKDQ